MPLTCSGLRLSLGRVHEWGVRRGCLAHLRRRDQSVAEVRIRVLVSTPTPVRRHRSSRSELVFHPFKTWIRRGPITPLFRKFLWSNIPLHSKISISAYIFSYWAISCAWFLTVLNYFLKGWNRTFRRLFQLVWRCRAEFDSTHRWILPALLEHYPRLSGAFRRYLKCGFHHPSVPTQDTRCSTDELCANQVDT